MSSALNFLPLKGKNKLKHISRFCFWIRKDQTFGIFLSDSFATFITTAWTIYTFYFVIPFLVLVVTILGKKKLFIPREKTN